ncbi:transposase [Cooperia oncophora]
MKNGLFTTISRSWSKPVWWDYKGIVYFELLPPNRTINSDVYIEQLTKLNNAVEEKRPEIEIEKAWYSIMIMQDTYLKIIGAWLGCFATCTIRLTFCFALYKTP